MHQSFKTTFIYCLKYPDTGKIRYVGKANNPEKRLRVHLYEARNPKNYRQAWVKGLLQRGRLPVLEVLDEVPIVQWQFWEREYIRVFSLVGMRLVNLSIGGEGPMTGRTHSEKTKERMSKARAGKPKPEGFGEGIRKFWTGRKRSPLSEDRKQALSERNSGTRNPFFGRRHSEEAKAKIWATRRERIRGKE
jgi:group I intron endonuclease